MLRFKNIYWIHLHIPLSNKRLYIELARDLFLTGKRTRHACNMVLSTHDCSGLAYFKIDSRACSSPQQVYGYCSNHVLGCWALCFCIWCYYCVMLIVKSRFGLVGDNQAAWALSVASARSRHSPRYLDHVPSHISSINNSSRISPYCYAKLFSNHVNAPLNTWLYYTLT